MKDKVIFIVIFCFLISCNDQDKGSSNKLSADTTSVDSIKNESKNFRNILSEKSSFAGSDTLFFNLRMDSVHQNILVPVHIYTGEKIGAAVYSSDEKANIRIAQIGYPDSTFDGPFGRAIIFNIKDTGEYKIIVSENMMAGDKWFGDFNLKVWIDK
jgi:hypothetical protein